MLFFNSLAIWSMTRTRQKTEERIYAECASALLELNWDIQHPENEREWPDLLIIDNKQTSGLGVRKFYPAEADDGSLKRVTGVPIRIVDKQGELLLS